MYSTKLTRAGTQRLLPERLLLGLLKLLRLLLWPDSEPRKRRFLHRFGSSMRLGLLLQRPMRCLDHLLWQRRRRRWGRRLRRRRKRCILHGQHDRAVPVWLLLQRPVCRLVYLLWFRWRRRWWWRRRRWWFQHSCKPARPFPGTSCRSFDLGHRMVRSASFNPTQTPFLPSSNIVIITRSRSRCLMLPLNAQPIGNNEQSAAIQCSAAMVAASGGQLPAAPSNLLNSANFASGSDGQGNTWLVSRRCGRRLLGCADCDLRLKFQGSDGRSTQRLLLRLCSW